MSKINVTLICLIVVTKHSEEYVYLFEFSYNYIIQTFKIVALYNAYIFLYFELSFYSVQDLHMVTIISFTLLMLLGNHSLIPNHVLQRLSSLPH